jgi:hypothetical protein
MKTFILFFTMILTSTLLSQTPQWEFMGLAGASIYDIAVDDSSNIYVASWTGVYKSTNNGATWEFKNNGLQIAEALKLFIDYEGNLYLGAVGLSNTGTGLYKSSDGGEYWAKIADTLNSQPINNFYDVTVIPNEPGGFIYVSNHYGVHRSTDNGITWQSTNFTSPGAIYIGMNTNGYMFFGNYTVSWFGIYRSTDLGLTWERHTLLSVEFSIEYLRDGSILAGCFDPSLGSHGIYKTTNNGDTWFNTNTLNFATSDFILDTNDDIYVSLFGLVYLSTNNGTSWINYGLTGPPTTCLAIDSSGYVWAGAHQDGVYRTAGRTVPVELVSFTYEVKGNNVLLSWITASEIQRLQDYKITELQDWKTIGFVEGYGTTTETKFYSFNDENLPQGNYSYRLKQIDFGGSFEYSNIIEVEVGKPAEFYLSQNYPNPFNPETNIDYIILEETLVNISLYDITGRKIKELINEKKQPGYYTLKLKGGGLSSGIYFYKLATSSGYTAVNKLTIIK